MDRTQESSRAWVLIDDIRASLQEFEPTTLAGQELYAEGLDQVQRLADARRIVVALIGKPGAFTLSGLSFSLRAAVGLSGPSSLPYSPKCVE